MESALYIHVPFCRQKCSYCDFFSVGESGRKGKCNDVSDGYVDALVREMAVYSARYGVSEWSTVYIGGGTPSILSAEQIAALMRGVSGSAALAPDAEVTIEANPENVDARFIECCAENGINRISVGIQALDDGALARAGRSANCSCALAALSLLEEGWNGHLSVDFIAGLPGQTWKSFRNQFSVLHEFTKIDHVSLYTLTVEENTPLWSQIRSGETAFSGEKADRMWISGRTILEKNGFRQYEVSNFSQPGCESRHNCAYWRQKNYIGVGAGATGTVYDFSRGTAERWTETLSIPAYISGVNSGNVVRNTERLDSGTVAFEFLMMGLRTMDGVLDSEYEARFGGSLAERLGADGGAFWSWRKRHLASVRPCRGGNAYSLNRRGILFLNSFLREIMV